MSSRRAFVIFLTIALPVARAQEESDSQLRLEGRLPAVLEKGDWDGLERLCGRNTPDAVSEAARRQDRLVEAASGEGSEVAGPFPRGREPRELRFEVDPRKDVHLVYIEEGGGAGGSIRHGIHRGGAWSRPESLLEAPRGQRVERALTTMDPAGRLHLMAAIRDHPPRPGAEGLLRYLRRSPDGRVVPVEERPLPDRIGLDLDMIRDASGILHLVWQSAPTVEGWPRVTHVTRHPVEGWSESRDPGTGQESRLALLGNRVVALGTMYRERQLASWTGDSWRPAHPQSNRQHLVLSAPSPPLLVDITPASLHGPDLLRLHAIDEREKLRPRGKIQTGPVAWRNVGDLVAFGWGPDGQPVGALAMGSFLYMVKDADGKTLGRLVAASEPEVTLVRPVLRLAEQKMHLAWVARGRSTTLRHAVVPLAGEGWEPLSILRARALAGRGFCDLDRDWLANRLYDEAASSAESGDPAGRVDKLIHLLACSTDSHAVPRATLACTELERLAAKDPALLTGPLLAFLEKDVDGRAPGVGEAPRSTTRPRLGFLLSLLDLEPGEKPGAERTADLDDIREAAFRHVMEVAAELSPPRPLGLAPLGTPFGEDFLDRFSDLDAPVSFEPTNRPDLRRLTETGRRFLAGGAVKVRVTLRVGPREAGRFWLRITESAGEWKVRSSRRLE